MSSKSTSPSTGLSTSKCIKEPLSQDVLCGRGRPIREHKGNIRYNKMIQDMRQEYEDAPNGRKLEVVKKLIDSIRADQGRFLHKKGDSWLELDADKVIVKTSQAFRDLRTDDNNQPSANAISHSDRPFKKFDYNDLKKRAPAGRFASLLHRRRESQSTTMAARSTVSSPSSTPPSSSSDPTSGDDDINKGKNSNARTSSNREPGSNKNQSERDDSETESEHSFPPIHS